MAPSSASPEKHGLHPRSRHRAGYDFPALIRSYSALAKFVRPGPTGRQTVDFSDPAAVKALNRALLAHHYGVSNWDIPTGYLCPPIPGRADYIHHLADLLAEGNRGVVPRGREVSLLDIGVGANCVYPIVGAHDYGWRFVGTDIDPLAVRSASHIVLRNPWLARLVSIRLQRSRHEFFAGVVQPRETFAASLCNPPFHRSAAEAAAGTQRKVRNLSGRTSAAPTLNFGGRSHELWCKGGESAFVRRLIVQSAARPELCHWFTSLVAKRENLPAIERALAAAKPVEVRIIPLAHGQKQSRIVAWRFR